MIAKPVVAGLLAAGCLGAAAAGAYVAVRQNVADEVAATPLTRPAAALPAGDTASGEPVSESEVALTPLGTPPADIPVLPAAAIDTAPAAPPLEGPSRRRAARVEPTPTPAASKRTDPPAAPPATRRTEPARTRVPADEAPVPADRGGSPPAIPAPMPEPSPAPGSALPPVFEPPPPPAPEFVEVVVPASSVIGLRLETSISTERAEVEDQVDARVTRDVTVDGRVAIPAGSRVIGAVTLVERGGKIKERARLGVRFHTLVFADGLRMPIRTDAIYRDGESPADSSSKKIGGAAVGGAILGAILGGGKGAAIGGAAGAAGGTAAAMAGDRRAATLPAGTMVTIRLSEPMTLEVEKQ